MNVMARAAARWCGLGSMSGAKRPTRASTARAASIDSADHVGIGPNDDPVDFESEAYSGTTVQSPESGTTRATVAFQLSS